MKNVMDLAKEVGAEVTDYINYAYDEDVAVFCAADLDKFRNAVIDECAKELEESDEFYFHYCEFDVLLKEMKK